MAVGEPSPSWPCASLPQQKTLSPEWAQVCAVVFAPCPAAMMCEAVKPAIFVGTSLGDPVLPIPSSPNVLSPQHHSSLMVPTGTTAHVCLYATVSSDGVERPDTLLGVPVSIWAPLPSCPLSLRPQQYVVPLFVTAQECCPPAARSTMVSPASAMGVG